LFEESGPGRTNPKAKKGRQLRRTFIDERTVREVVTLRIYRLPRCNEMSPKVEPPHSLEKKVGFIAFGLDFVGFVEFAVFGGLS